MTQALRTPPPHQAPAVPARPQAPLPRDVNATAEETLIATLGGWRFVGMGKVPLITRKPAGIADAKRRAFLADLAPIRAGLALPLLFYAQEIGRLWNTALPADFPAGYRPNPPAGTPPPDLCAAVVVLLRTGLLVVDGFKVDAVTRSELKPSQLGYLFIRNEEGLAPRIYWPGNDNSGVTVGPGYDMGSRTTDQIAADLTGIGLPSASVATLSKQAAQLLGEQAGTFAKANRQLVNLSLIQQQSLFDLVIPSYIDLVHKTTPKSLATRLFQHEFEAMLSLAWNLRRYGGYSFNGDIGRLDMVKADPSMKTLTGGGPGIPGRRVRETTLFTDATYVIKPLTLRNSDIEFYDDRPASVPSHA